MNNATIDVWFDYSSPYGYLASERIEAIAIAHTREVVWHPFLLGALFKLTGGAPLVDLPMKADYAWHDMQRAAREHAIPFVRPSPFPIATVAAARATLWLRDHPSSAVRVRTTELVHALFRAFYAEGRDIARPGTVLDTVADIGLPRDEAEAALADPAIKARLADEVDAAVAQEIFGSPMMVVDGQRFWGHDRLGQIDRWLARGGW